MSPLALSLPTTAEHVWTASGPAAEHQLVPATNLDIDRSRVRVLVQLDPAVIVPAILTAVGTPVLRTLAAAYRKSGTKAARDAAIGQLVPGNVGIREQIFDPAIIRSRALTSFFSTSIEKEPEEGR